MGICASVAVDFCAAVVLLMGVQILACISVKSGLVCTKIGYIVTVVTGNPGEKGGGCVLGGLVLYECLMSSVDRYEGRAVLFEKLLRGGSLVCDTFGSVYAGWLFVGRILRADHLFLYADESAERFCRRTVVV